LLMARAVVRVTALDQPVFLEGQRLGVDKGLGDDQVQGGGPAGIAAGAGGGCGHQGGTRAMSGGSQVKFMENPR
jgi:hypothetical protein